MTYIQSGSGAAVAITVSGTPFIRTDSGPLVQDGHCVLKVLTLNGQRLVDNTLRFFNVLAPGIFPGSTKAEEFELSPGLNIRSTCHPDLLPLPRHENHAIAIPKVQQSPVRDSAWWRFTRKPKANKKPNQKAMMLEYLFHGCIHLHEGHPQYEERKSILLRKGFHFNGERGACVPDPKWSPEPA